MPSKSAHLPPAQRAGLDCLLSTARYVCQVRTCTGYRACRCLLSTEDPNSRGSSKRILRCCKKKASSSIFEPGSTVIRAVDHRSTQSGLTHTGGRLITKGRSSVQSKYGTSKDPLGTLLHFHLFTPRSPIKKIIKGPMYTAS
eukprot:422169-Pelagomonas_calceolata.AAC.2